jgi:AcrR family transcriptional regulator
MVSKENKSSRPRQSRAVLRDGIILDAAQEILANAGWRALSLLSTADAAGVSRKSLHSRYANKNSLAVEVWRERLSIPLLATLKSSLSAGGLLDSKPVYPKFEASLLAAARPSQALLGSVELLIISLFEPEIRDEVSAQFKSQVLEWTTPKPGKISRSLAAQRAYVIAISLGYILAARYPQDKNRINVKATATNLFESLLENRKPTNLPQISFKHFEEEIDFETGDLAIEALFNATLKMVGGLGYEGASINLIAQEAGFTEGLIFSRYKNKLELFLAATHAAGAIGLRKSNDAMTYLEKEWPLGVAEAIFMREYLKPGIDRSRALHLEKLRVSWGIPALLESQIKEIETFVESAKKGRKYWGGSNAFNYIHAAYAMGLGLSLFATINPNAYLLPLDVVTVLVEERLRKEE